MALARITKTMAERRILREKQKEAALSKKLETQKMKEIYGENWKKGLQDSINKEIEIEIGNIKTPKVYDITDTYKFFDPINFYKDKENKPLKMDLKAFIASEEKYKEAIEELDKELEKINLEDDKEDKDIILKEDGTSSSDSVEPVPEYAIAETEEFLDAKKQREENEKKEKEKQDKTKGKDKNNKALSPEEELQQAIKKAQEETQKIDDTPRALSKAKLWQTISTYFNRFLPLYTKWVCPMCGQIKNIEDYYIVYDLTCADKIDKNGNVRMHICKDCANKLFAYLYSVVAEKDVELAMQYFCSYVNIYWDTDYFQIARKKYNDDGRKGTLVGAYIKYINVNACGLTFMDSPILEEGYKTVSIVEKDDAPYDWTQEDYNNKQQVLNFVGYDPFENYADTDQQKKTLYADLLSIIDEDIQNDFVKLQSAITIVKSFFKVRLLDEKLHQLEKDNASLKEQKDLVSIKNAELKAITDFSAANGFSERFKTKQARGENTFTGVVARMDKQKFEKSIANRFDVQTAASMQQCSDMSFESIFKQLSLSESDMFKVTADQLSELRKLRSENAKLAEQLRVAKYKLAEITLKDKVKDNKESGDE